MSPKATRADNGGWSRLGLELTGKVVTDVEVDPHDSLKMAVVASHQLYLSADGGISWQLQVADSPMSFSYDSAREGRQALTSNGSCLQVRDSVGSSWRQYRLPDTSQCTPGLLVSGTSGFFFINQGYNGNSDGVYHLKNDGTLIRLSNVPSAHPRSLFIDQTENRLYITTEQEMFSSGDGGESWTQAAAAGQIGCCTQNMAAAGDTIWTVSSNRLFVSHNRGASWVPQGSQLYGWGFGQLLLHGTTPYFGMTNTDIGVGDVVANQADFDHARLGLGRMAYRLAASGNNLIAGTADGLWVDTAALHSAASIKRPVIVIPGIMGSWPEHYGVTGKLVLDPVAGTYDKLIAKLKSIGYRENAHTLYTFPYEWRQENELSARELKVVIDQAKFESGSPKVDLVAHSMGGLIARYYIEGDDYGNDVNKLIELGTPNDGSVNAYYTWEDGRLYSLSNQGRQQNRALYAIFQTQAYLRGFKDFGDYIRNQVLSVRELLPDYSYIVGRTYPAGYPENTFLHELNRPSKVALLKSRIKLRVIGSDDLDTLGQIEVTDPTPDKNWSDGRVVKDFITGGDGTVPFWSLVGLEQTDWVTSSEHQQLPNDAKNVVAKYLLDDEPDASYLGTIPDQEHWQSLSDAAHADLTDALIVYAPAGVELSVADKAGHQISDRQHNWSEAVYLGGSSDPSMIVLRNPPTNLGELQITVNNHRGSAFPLGVIQTMDGRDDKNIEVTIPAGEGADSVVQFDPEKNVLAQPNLPAAPPDPIVSPTPTPTPTPTPIDSRASQSSVSTETGVVLSDHKVGGTIAVAAQSTSGKTKLGTATPGSVLAAMTQTPMNETERTYNRLLVLAIACLVVALAIWNIAKRKSL